MLISIVIPTYNRPIYLKRSVQTVLQQTHQNFEIMVVDDTSPDVNKHIINSFGDGRIKYIRNENRRGACYSRNRGIAEAKGEYIAFLDDDDEWIPTKLEEQIKLFDNDNVGLVTCYSLDKRFRQERIAKPPDTVTRRMLLKSFRLSPTSSFLVKKEVFDRVGYFDLNLASAHEYDLALRISKYYEIRTVPEALMVQNASDEQISGNYTKKIRGTLSCYRKYHKEYRTLGIAGCILNHLKTVGLLGLFFLGFIFGNKIYKIINPLKELYEKL